MNAMIYSESLPQAQEEGLTIIDIRRPEEWAARTLEQADMQVEMTDLLNHPDAHLQAQQRYLLVCAAGVRAQYCAAILRGQGYDNVFAYPSGW